MPKSESLFQTVLNSPRVFFRNKWGIYKGWVELLNKGTATTLAGYGITDAYTSATVDTKLATKANTATTLAGYGISDAYTKNQTDTLLATKQPNLWFTPVHQGGGAYQGTNTVYIGWSTDGSGVRVQVDSSDMGHIFTDAQFADLFINTQGATAVGSYMFCNNVSGTSVGPGGTVAGASLKAASDNGVGSVLSGTWRCMGYSPNGASTLYLRIA